MRISVIIPTYNRRELTARAVDSVLSQSHPADEIIVVDDHSADGTYTHLSDKYGKRIKLYQMPKNSGVSATRNFAIAQSCGDWLALLDSDDEWYPDKLKLQISKLNSDPHVICHSEEIWIRNGVRVNQMKKHQKHGGVIFEQCLALCAMSPSSVLMKKNVFEQAGGFDETLPACEDYDLWLKICAVHPVLYIDTPLIKKFGGHADQLSRQYWGMDRFRVQSLHKLISSNILTDSQRVLATNTLLKKAKILQTGALKHNNLNVQAFCEKMITCHG